MKNKSVKLGKWQSKDDINFKCVVHGFVNNMTGHDGRLSTGEALVLYQRNTAEHMLCMEYDEFHERFEFIEYSTDHLR